MVPGPQDGRRGAPGATMEGVMAAMEFPEHYELVFQAPAVADDVVVVHRTDRTGAGGCPVYQDATGIVRAEISERGEVRMLASGAHQVHPLPVVARVLTG